MQNFKGLEICKKLNNNKAVAKCGMWLIVTFVCRDGFMGGGRVSTAALKVSKKGK